MKAILNIILVALVVSAMLSCKKNIALENETIIGKWRQVQTYQGYINDENYAWTNNPTYLNREIEFMPNGEFFEKSDSAESVRKCSGSYRTYSGNKLDLTSSCQPFLQTFVISQQSSSGLIIDHLEKEGIVRERFMRVINY